MYKTREANAQYMREWRAGKRRLHDRVELLARVEQMERALQQIRVLSNYPGKERSTFTRLAEARRKINKLACDALREEG